MRRFAQTFVLAPEGTTSNKFYIHNDVFMYQDESQSSTQGPQRPKGRRIVRYPDAHQLFVGNIPHDVEKPELMDFFEQFGSVLDFKIICREKHPNFGFVVFNDSEPIELFDNVRLNVQKKKTHSPREVERGDARPRPGTPIGGGVRGPSSQGGGTNKPSLGSVCGVVAYLSLNSGSTYPTMGNSVYLILLQLVWVNQP
uniref:RRM domain-containing protein n=1 Tax=Gouania willdenowi TaxID=441366 RepID=A0A8C5GTU7_GOUWI